MCKPKTPPGWRPSLGAFLEVEIDKFVAKNHSGSRIKSAEEFLNHKEHKEHKEIFITSRTVSASPRLRVRFAREFRTLFVLFRSLRVFRVLKNFANILRISASPREILTGTS